MRHECIYDFAGRGKGKVSGDNEPAEILAEINKIISKAEK